MGPPTCVTCGASITDHWFYMSQDWEFTHLGCLLPGEPGHDAGASRCRSCGWAGTVPTRRPTREPRCPQCNLRLPPGHEPSPEPEVKASSLSENAGPPESGVDVETPPKAKALKAAITNLLRPYYGSGPTSNRFNALWLTPEKVADRLVANTDPKAWDSASPDLIERARKLLSVALITRSGVDGVPFTTGEYADIKRWLADTEGADDGRD